MNKVVSVAVVLLGTLLTLGVAQEAGSPAAKELAQFEGTWELVAVEADGNKVPDEVVRGCRFTFKGNSFTAGLGDLNRAGTFKVDPSKKPHTMDITMTSGPQENTTQPAIYSLDGDTLKICGTQPGKERPTDFDTKGKTQTTLMVLKRQR